jgi:hypothetical protein
MCRFAINSVRVVKQQAAPGIKSFALLAGELDFLLLGKSFFL